MALDGEDHDEWLALLRVRQERVSKRGQGYLYCHQPYPDVSLIAAALARLERSGMVLVETDDGRLTVMLTEAGRARYEALERRRRAPDTTSLSTIRPERPMSNPSVTLQCTCQPHQTGTGFCNLRVTKDKGGGIVLDPHVDGDRSCVLCFDVDEAVALRDLLIDWLGWQGRR
ncbi:MAG: hypothetical protein ACRDSZ_18940 [Pseudonocardiaceae bacterium]